MVEHNLKENVQDIISKIKNSDSFWYPEGRLSCYLLDNLVYLNMYIEPLRKIGSPCPRNIYPTNSIEMKVVDIKDVWLATPYAPLF